MNAPEDYVLGLLLVHFRKAAGDRVKEARKAARARGVALATLAVDQGLASASEVAGLLEAARFVISGDALRACAACSMQVIAPTGTVVRCPRCSQGVMRGVLPSPAECRIDPALERRLRGLAEQATARKRTGEQVTEVHRLAVEGRVGRRPEAHLAPRDQAYSGATLGPYRLEQLVGRGGSSYVYRATDTRDGRTVALKVLCFGQGETAEGMGEKLARFRREAELASALEHPNIVDVGPLEQAGPWYAIPMTFVGGPSLAQILDARKTGQGAAGMPASALAHALADVARALHYAHSRGVVHRDVSPRNILFSETGQPHLSDFGSARSLGLESSLTGQGVVLGGSEYAAPERFDSEKNADARSDVFGLGVILYEILAGRRPFEGSNPAELMTRILKSDPVPPRSVNAEVTPALEAVALQALAKDPARRHATAQEFAEELAAALAGEAAGAESAPPGALALNRATLLALAVAFLLGTAVLAPFARRGGPDAEGLLGAASAALARLERSKTAKEHLALERECRGAVAAAAQLLPEGHPDLLFCKGRLALAQGDLRQAGRELERAAAFPGDDARLLHGVVQYFLAERYGTSSLAVSYQAAARGAFLDLSACVPETWQGRVARAMAAAIEGRSPAAVEDLKGLAGSDGQRPEVRLLHAWLLLRQADSAHAAAILHPLAEQRPADPLVRMARAIAYLEQKRTGEAKEEAAAMLERWPCFVEGLIVEARAQLAAGAFSRALDALKRLHLLDPGLPEGYRLRARAHVGLGSVHEVVADLTLLLEVDPGAAQALLDRAQAFLKLGDKVRALADAKACVQAFPYGDCVGEAKALLAQLER